MNTAARIRLLEDELERFDPTLPCPWLLAEQLNVLLANAKEHVQNDPVLDVMQPIGQRSEHKAGQNCGTVRGLAAQVRQAVTDAQGPREGAVPWGEGRSILTEPM